ncbi:Ribosomal protein S6 kinase alpha-5 [Frankliniella fusca]|uniref:Ribosomal protein S6 kinase alpha-5 n=1 Tax=Frankliniella fusca TaxID=407009 RepID=A0AAE1LH76_9NEOP|nr:Ribosomal protein S6 kinase alpha-5 [Frankliniella fusca]
MAEREGRGERFPEAVVDLRSSGAAGAAGGAGDVAEAEAEVGAGGSGGVTAGESGPRTSSAAESPPPALKLCSQAARDGAEAVAEVGAGGGVTAGAPRPRTSSAAGSPPPALERCSPAAQDLVRRLLERDPRRRLRSLHTLQTIAFFFQFSFADVRAKKVRPRDLWPEVPASEPERASDADNGAFQGFDDVAPIYV